MEFFRTPAVIFPATKYERIPVIVPVTTDPFFSSTVTVSLFSFIKNLKTKADQHAIVVGQGVRWEWKKCSAMIVVARDMRREGE
jgi:hypothetical protein